MKWIENLIINKEMKKETNNELKDGWIEEFEFQQKRIWQLPENTIFERQTIQMIKDFIIKVRQESIQQERERIWGEVEKIILETDIPNEYKMDGRFAREEEKIVYVYNKALSDTKDIIFKGSQPTVE
jgi:hypothetical protein